MASALLSLVLLWEKKGRNVEVKMGVGREANFLADSMLKICLSYPILAGTSSWDLVCCRAAAASSNLAKLGVGVLA